MASSETPDPDEGDNQQGNEGKLAVDEATKHRGSRATDDGDPSNLLLISEDEEEEMVVLPAITKHVPRDNASSRQKKEIPYAKERSNSLFAALGRRQVMCEEAEEEAEGRILEEQVTFLLVTCILIQGSP